MRKLSAFLVGIGVGFCWSTSGLAADHFVSPDGGNLAPFTSWDTAATNIQDAIDAASAGEVVWVTNGVYAAGGKVMAGDLTNRVTLDKALTVRSVNGPFVTIIQGAWDPAATNGPLAVRCAWLTNGASLIGFTLQRGATRNLGTQTTLESGGGVWSSALSANVANCIILSNAAFSSGCGAYGGTLNGCAIIGNIGSATHAATSANLTSCTVVSNSCGGPFAGSYTNCILYFNQSQNSSGQLSYCCTTPTPPGGGNIVGPPQLLGDGIHLASSSPCLAAGTNAVSGSDIDGQPWATLPSIGCDEWYGSPLKTQPKVSYSIDPVGFSIGVTLVRSDPFICSWTRNGIALADDGHFSGSQTTNLTASGVSLSDAGAYQIVISNAFGMGTGAVLLVVHCVDAGRTNPTAPFLDWSTAANKVQDAIDAALPGEIVLVTNGIYADGGKVMGGDLTNRVALDKPILMHGVNGATHTTIQGLWDPATTNGPSAVRCAWLTNGAVLSGFTLQGGATRASSSSPDAQQIGGGVIGSSSNAIVVNCLIQNNSAGFAGGGASQVSLVRCALMRNSAAGTAGSAFGGGAYVCNLTNCTVSGNFSSRSGGGASGSVLRNCALTQNVAFQNGGGVDSGTLINCTLAANSAGQANSPGQGGGAYLATLTNCIVYGNKVLYPTYASTSNYYSGALNFCCAAPLPPGAGNIASNPQFLSDGLHLASTSPCRGAGSTSAARGTDIDGQPWASPVSIGCDEWLPNPIILGAPQVNVSGTPPLLNLWGLPIGQGPFSFWWLKDNTVLQDPAKYSSPQTTNLTVNNFGPEDAGSYQLVASNSFGVVTSVVATVVVHCVNPGATASAPPYSDWSTAATSIQDAIDSAGPGEFVLVTNGIYSTGGRAMAGDLTNRVVVNKPLHVTSINGAVSTVIQGAHDPATTNGPLAARCVWLGQGATLGGFTLLGGATRNAGDTVSLQSGGGAWCASTNESLISCILSNNAAASYGGGSYQGQLQRSILWGNAATFGGGAYSASLNNCLVQSNSASFQGGGLCSSIIVNCTIIANQAQPSQGGGEFGSKAWNSIIFYNFAPGSLYQFYANDWDIRSQSSLVASWTSSANYPLFNTTPGPQFTTDGFHLAASSPCRGTGNSLYSAGTDLDGDPWLSPPSIGCDEFYDSDFTGPLLLGPVIAYDVFTRGAPLRNGNNFVSTTVSGNADRVAWSFGDGVTRTNSFAFVTSHTWTNEGDFNVTFTAYNADNPAGVSTNGLIHVILPNQPRVSAPVFTGTNFTLTFSSQAGITYVVEQTASLIPPVIWQTLTSVPGSVSGSPVAVADNSITNLNRFYRVRAL